MEKVERKKPRYPALDVLRILAIIGIIIYHYYPQYLPGGFIGVDVFLVLSGFLFAHHYYPKLRSGRTDSFLRSTWKRLERLWWPLVFMVIISLGVIGIIAPAFLFNVRRSLISGLTFTNNWWQIAQGSSYFAEFVNPSAYTHLWYVAVQMQFYILLPLILIVAYHLLGSRERVALTLVVLAGISALAMALLYRNGGDPSRVYYGTDTRAYGFLLGAAAGVMRRPVDHGRGNKESFVADGLALFSLAGLLLMAHTLIDQKAFTYRGGLVITVILATLMILGLCSGRLSNRFLDARPLHVLSEHTYALYLWYYPVFAVAGRLPWIRSQVWLQWILMILLAILTHALVEKRWMAFIHGARRREKILARDRYQGKRLIAILLMLAISFSAVIAFGRAPAGKNQTVAEMEAQLLENQRKLAAKKAKEAAEKAAKTSPDIPNQPGLDRQVMLAMHDKPVSFIGDSILLSAVAGLTDVFPKSHIDGQVGRQLIASNDVVKAMESRGELADPVVIVLGSNGTFTEDQLNDLLALLDKRRIYLVNTHVDRPWQGDVNAQLQAYAKAHKNAVLIDWNQAAAGHPEWFYEDGTHCNPEGAVGFANLVANSIYKDEQALKKDKKTTNKNKEKTEMTKQDKRHR